MKLIISNVSGVPIYEQIKQQVKAAILSGELKEEEALPSLRTLAKDLKISVLTVTRAYTELEQEGFVKNVQGRGCFVLGSGSELMKEQLICKVENSLTEAIKAAKIANLSNEELHHLLDILLEANTDADHHRRAGLVRQEVSPGGGQSENRKGNPETAAG